MQPRPTIEAFDGYLAALGLRLEAVVVGGAALGLLRVTSRPTRDFDILAPELPPPIIQAAGAFAREQRRLGIDLGENWLNNGPRQLGDVLPAGWQLRTQLVFEGRALVLSTLGRADLLKTKLFALCDRGTDLSDQDANPDWPAHVRATLANLQRKLGHGV